MTMTFTGWSESAVKFYEGLETDNSKTYWAANRAVYDSEVLAPMQALLADLADEFGEGKTFRPHRDIRFSTDKSPYKTSIGAMLGQGYVEFSARGIGVGAGRHMMAPDQLSRMRAAVAADTTGSELEDIISTLTAEEIEVVARDRLATAPRGFPKDHPRAELLRNKDLAAWKLWPATETWLHTAAAEEHIVAVLRASQPLVRWLDENVGATTRQPQR